MIIFIRSLVLCELHGEYKLINQSAVTFVIQMNLVAVKITGGWKTISTAWGFEVLSFDRPHFHIQDRIYTILALHKSHKDDKLRKRNPVRICTKNHSATYLEQIVK